jgi:1-aminocyclopropane-1-carboxylate deaminase
MRGLKAIGIIRGEQPEEFSATLIRATELGMQLAFSSRKSYSTKQIPDDLLSDEAFIIPEGGYGEPGAKGAATILDYCKKENYTHIACAVGTGTMMAGLVNAALPHQQVVGISVLKNNKGLDQQVKVLVKTASVLYSLFHDYHFGGYAKYTQDLIRFMNEFYETTGVASDFVYTGKLFYGVTDLIRENRFPPGGKILIVHSGGLQGNVSLKKATLIF